MINIHHEEFVCYRFIHNVFAVMAVTEGVVKDLTSNKKEITSDYYMFLHFDAMQKKLHIMLDDPEMTAAFKRRYPGREDLLTLAAEQSAALERLHSVRVELLSHHVAPCGTDIHCHKDDLRKPIEMTEEEHADSLGLDNVDQLNAWKSQVDLHGHVILSEYEKQTLKDAILAEFSGL
jgi:hypothetical protein